MWTKVELIGRRERRTIQVVPYDASWPDAFARERTRIRDALGTRARRIDHVGSTAVAGLAAKPIIDIDVSFDHPDDEDAYVPALERAGYQLRVREPGHRMLRTATLDVHVHICATGSEWERRHLLFRDWLRCDAGDRERYAQTKRQLADRDWPDLNAYAAAKTDLIKQITSRAEQWAIATSWRPGWPGLTVRIVGVAIDQQRRLQEAAAQAHSAQDQGDYAGANEAWRRYVLIEDALRDPQELLDEGVALSKVAIDLWLQR